MIYYYLLATKDRSDHHVEHYEHTKDFVTTRVKHATPIGAGVPCTQRGKNIVSSRKFYPQEGWEKDKVIKN